MTNAARQIIFIFFIFATITLIGQVQAGELEDGRAKLVAAIDRVDRVFKPQCSRHPNSAVCVAAYNMANARNRASIAEIDFWIAASATTGALRQDLSELVTTEEYNRDNIVTKRRSDKVDLIFGTNQ